MSNIDFALVEETRPPIYRAMKYWGKKPHNIWSKYIDFYTPKNGIFLDPFAGSGISIFESFKLGRKTVGYDLNPLTSFLIETYFTKFNLQEFINEFNIIKKDIITDPIYIRYFSSVCTYCGTNAIHFS